MESKSYESHSLDDYSEYLRKQNLQATQKVKESSESKTGFLREESVESLSTVYENFRYNDLESLDSLIESLDRTSGEFNGLGSLTTERQMKLEQLKMISKEIKRREAIKRDLAQMDEAIEAAKDYLSR